MKVHDDHLYHGAALIQVAEHKRFTAINALYLPSGQSRNAFRVNDNLGLYLKYASKARGANKEFFFTFNRHNLDELVQVASVTAQVFIGLVCVESREICCLTKTQLQELLGRRERSVGHAEAQVAIIASLPTGGSFRVCVNAPGTKGKMLGKPLLITRRSFPHSLFGT